jgi:hypothetical protein
LVSRVSSSAETKIAAVHGYTTAFEVSALLVAMSAVVAAIFIGPKSSHVLEGDVLVDAPIENQPAFALE